MSTGIEWTEETWNPIVGCSKVSEGCKHCYAITMANRLAHIPATVELYMDTVTVGANGMPNWTGVVKVSENAMDKPLRTKKPTMWFVNSMSDLFHDSVPFSVIDKIFAVMGICQQHTFQILTKRPERMLEYFNYKDKDWKNEGMQGDERIRYQAWHTFGAKIEFDNWKWPLPNVWLGVSVENQKCADERVPLLLQVPAAVRFLSCEPLLGAVDLNELIVDIDWLICGGESGTGSRPMHPEWVRSLRNQCESVGVPFFFKQWGDWMSKGKPADEEDVMPLGKKEQWLNLAGGMGFHGEEVYRMMRVGKGSAGKKIDGKEWVEMPVMK